MITKKLVKEGLAYALAEAAYIALVASFMMFAEDFFGPGPNVLAAVTMLMLFVLSAAISGALILGKPILLYLDNNKKEAVQLFGITLSWLFLFLIVSLSMLLIF